MRNHKSFPDKLYYKFLLCVPVLVFKENYIFCRFFEMPTGQTSTQLRLSETEDKHCKKAFFFLLFVNCMHTGVDCITGKASRVTGFFVIVLIFFVYSIGLIFATASK